MHIAELRRRLREHRLDRRWSYNQLANDVGMSEAAVRRFICKESEPRETTVHVIERYLSRADETVSA